MALATAVQKEELKMTEEKPVDPISEKWQTPECYCLKLCDTEDGIPKIKF